MSNLSWLEGRVVSSLFPGKKGGGIVLPKCAHFHVAKSNRCSTSVVGLFLKRSSGSTALAERWLHLG